MRKSYYFIISTLILSAILPNTGIAQMNQSQINQELNKINKSITEEKAKSSTITKEINQIEQQKKQNKIGNNSYSGSDGCCRRETF
ncbi:hypothetical protein EXW96_18465 [Paenibacillus sp. JMULE4]|uniref:hypothetical protein n=1 Tax=Paenibacillus sp. JMULE4 TaxID=2518342 RepID=UPI001576AB6E|nr:hypothetical protein [Paenibacillus sp. JMULE4]NTZ19474.1 hypothetical protein [Paenibacillus sp. JMULE4]